VIELELNKIKILQRNRIKEIVTSDMKWDENEEEKEIRRRETRHRLYREFNLGRRWKKTDIQMDAAMHNPAHRINTEMKTTKRIL